MNLGLAGAFQTGMLYACRHGYDCAVQFDADKQHRPEYVPALIEAIADNNIVIGSRFVDRKKPRTLRMAGSRLISFAIKLTTGRTIKDPTSGMRCFNRRTMELLASGINVGPEPDTLAYLIRSAHARVREVQVTVDERSAGKSYLNMKTSVAYMVRILLSVLFIQFFRKARKIPRGGARPRRKSRDDAGLRFGDGPPVHRCRRARGLQPAAHPRPRPRPRRHLCPWPCPTNSSERRRCDHRAAHRPRHRIVRHGGAHVAPHPPLESAHRGLRVLDRAF